MESAAKAEAEEKERKRVAAEEALKVEKARKAAELARTSALGVDAMIVELKRQIAEDGISAVDKFALEGQLASAIKQKAKIDADKRAAEDARKQAEKEAKEKAAALEAERQRKLKEKAEAEEKARLEA